MSEPYDPYDPCHEWIGKCHELQAKVERILHFATGPCRMSDVDRILAIAKECEAEYTEKSDPVLGPWTLVKPQSQTGG